LGDCSGSADVKLYEHLCQTCGLVAKVAGLNIVGDWCGGVVLML